MTRVKFLWAMLIFLPLSSGFCFAQKDAGQPKRIYFNLYTDSIKTQLYYYVNIEGEYPNGRYLPLDTATIGLSADQGSMAGNSWIPPKKIDFESVRFTVWLRCNPQVRDSIQVWLKRALDPRDNMDLPTEPVEIRKRKR